MKNKYLFILLALSFFSCSVDDSVDIKGEEQTTYVPKFPFEALDQTNFNNASSVLTAAPSNVRLDSVVTFRYYRFNPEANNNIQNITTYSSGPVAGLPPVEPTNRKIEIYTYNSQNYVQKIETFIQYDEIYLKRGELSRVDNFIYNSNFEIIKYNNQNYDGNYVYTYGAVFNYLNGNMKDFRGYSENSFHEQPNLVTIDGNEVSIKYPNYKEEIIGYVYKLDFFGNVLNYRSIQSPTEVVNNFYYHKNIFNPYSNLYPNNFKPYLYFRDQDFANMHYQSRVANGYSFLETKEIQLNENGFPAIIQSGSYDDGYRTKYYYSTY